MGSPIPASAEYLAETGRALPLRCRPHACLSVKTQAAPNVLHWPLDYLLQYGEQKANMQVWRWSVLPGWPRRHSARSQAQVEYLEMPARSILNRSKPACRFSGPLTPIEAANSAVNTAMRDTHSSSWSCR